VRKQSSRLIHQTIYFLLKNIMFVIILSLRTSIQENKFFYRKTRSLCLKWIQEWLEKKPQPLEDELLHIILRFICQPKIDNRFICILNMHTSDVTLHFPVQLFVIFLRLFSFYSTLCQRYQAVWTAELRTMSSSMNSSTSGVKNRFLVIFRPQKSKIISD
jgi:hypothetical protein